MQVYYHSMTQKRLMYQLVFGQQEDRHQMKSERGVEQLLCHFGYSNYLVLEIGGLLELQPQQD